MKIYLVRHGETGENVARRHQPETSHLNEHGKEQAAALAKRVKQLRPTHLVVSTHVRALETAQAIAAATDLIPETNELFIELCRPKHIYALRRNHPKSLWYLWRWFFAKSGSSVCGEDGESYAALRSRVAIAKNYLKTLPADATVVVITHSVFMNFFLAHLSDERPIKPNQAIKVFWNILHTKNTGLVALSYDASSDKFIKD